MQISAGKYLQLLPGDQAGREMVKHGRIFHGLVEGPITFMPTYKFDKGLPSSHLQPFYDQGEKKRVPAWTDRVFFRGSGSQWSALEPGRGGKSEVQVRAPWQTLRVVSRVLIELHFRPCGDIHGPSFV
jgi:hypothetical protein